MNWKWMPVLGIVLMAAQASAGETPALKTQKEKVSYAAGVDMARSLQRQGVEVDRELFLKGVKDGLSGGTLLLSDDDINKMLKAFKTEQKMKLAERKYQQSEQLRKQRQAAALVGEENRKAGEAFLAANKAKDGVVTLPSGLQYRILKAGDGGKPSDADTVECRYRGTLIDGTEFDRSDPAGQPATFKVAGVIPGWREALKLMPAGSKWQLFIPPQLAYGARGAGRAIGPNATLIFDLELLAVK
jgi:FKBP-type peptidyl-prolyl cis-trans isomerase FklB